MNTIDVNTISRADLDALDLTPHSLFIGADLNLDGLGYFGSFAAGRDAATRTAITIETHDLTPLGGAMLLTYNLNTRAGQKFDMVAIDDVTEGVDIIRKALAELATPTWDDVKHLL